MVDNAKSKPQQEFARAFGDALKRFLDGKMGQSEAAKLLGLVDANGKPRRSRLNSYFHDSADGGRTEARALILFLACTKLPGFYFDYAGYRLKAVRLHGKRREQTSEQLALNFYRKYELAAEAGKIDIKVRRPAGRIEVSVSLDAKAS